MTTDFSTLSSLQTEDHTKLLDDIDNLRSTVLSTDISLPQIIVCGDQSSGKSSVLEAISHATFPVKDGRCTKFPTEIVLRKADMETAIATIQPGRNASAEHRDALKNFRQTGESLSSLGDLVSQAEQAIGLPPGKEWSDDVLRLEISGPSCPQLSLVDLPGLIHTTEQMTNEHELVRDLVRSYMKDKRSIILLVIQAVTDAEMQIALQLAREVDPEGKRTMGVLTKPDTLDPGSSKETTYFKIIEAAPDSQKYKLGLGWHVVRNLKENERTDKPVDRDAEEKALFAKRPWNNLPASQLGIESLRTKLSRQLLNHIQAEIPSVIRDIEVALNESSGKLKALGTARDTEEAQRSFLFTVTAEFHDVVKATCDGHWDHTKLHDNPAKRLRARLRAANDNFASKMRYEGRTWEVTTTGVSDNPRPLIPGGPVCVSLRQRIEDIDKQRKASLGRELPGTPTPALVGTLFREQSKKWEMLATKYVEECLKIAKQVLELLLVDCCGSSAFMRLWPTTIMPDLRTRRDVLVVKLQELLSPYVEHHPATLNPRFLEMLQKQEAKAEEEGEISIELELPEEVDASACLRLWRTTQVFYDIALATFVDNVSSLAIENCLIKGLADILSSTKVSKMSKEQLERLAGDSHEDRESRQRLTDKVRSLKIALDTCREHEQTPPQDPGFERQGLAQELEGQTSDNSSSRLFNFTPAPSPGRATVVGSTSSGIFGAGIHKTNLFGANPVFRPASNVDAASGAGTNVDSSSSAFGSSSVPKSPSSANTRPTSSVFGTPTSANTASSPFGANAKPTPPAFGTPNATNRAGSPFGANVKPPAPSFGGFGSTSGTSAGVGAFGHPKSPAPGTPGFRFDNAITPLRFVCDKIDNTFKGRTSFADPVFGSNFNTGSGWSTHISFLKDLSPEELRLNDYALVAQVPDSMLAGTHATMDSSIEDLRSLRMKLGRMKLHGKG